MWLKKLQGPTNYLISYIVLAAWLCLTNLSLSDPWRISSGVSLYLVSSHLLLQTNILPDWLLDLYFSVWWKAFPITASVRSDFFKVGEYHCCIQTHWLGLQSSLQEPLEWGWTSQESHWTHDPLKLTHAGHPKGCQVIWLFFQGHLPKSWN